MRTSDIVFLSRLPRVLARVARARPAPNGRDRKSLNLQEKRTKVENVEVEEVERVESVDVTPMTAKKKETRLMHAAWRGYQINAKTLC